MFSDVMDPPVKYPSLRSIALTRGTSETRNKNRKHRTGKRKFFISFSVILYFISVFLRFLVDSAWRAV